MRAQDVKDGRWMRDEGEEPREDARGFAGGVVDDAGATCWACVSHGEPRSDAFSMIDVSTREMHDFIATVEAADADGALTTDTSENDALCATDARVRAYCYCMLTARVAIDVVTDSRNCQRRYGFITHTASPAPTHSYAAVAVTVICFEAEYVCHCLM